MSDNVQINVLERLIFDLRDRVTAVEEENKRLGESLEEREREVRALRRAVAEQGTAVDIHGGDKQEWHKQLETNWQQAIQNAKTTPNTVLNQDLIKYAMENLRNRPNPAEVVAAINGSPANAVALAQVASLASKLGHERAHRVEQVIRDGMHAGRNVQITTDRDPSRMSHVVRVWYDNEMAHTERVDLWDYAAYPDTIHR